MALPNRLIGLIAIVWATLFCTFSPPALANDAEIKAAFIYNIIKYTNWPEEALPRDSQLILCYVGAANPLSEAIASLHGKHVDAHTLTVRNTSRLDALEPCHVVVLGQDIGIDALRQLHLPFALTLGEGEGFVDAGGSIGLFPLGGRIRFDVNLDASHANGITISAYLLRLARNVRGRQ
jgi:hypothetical protein